MSKRHHNEQSGLPSGYTRLQYIESTGTQWIDTGVQGNDKLVIELCYAQTVLTNWNTDYHGQGVDNWNQKVLLRINHCYTGEYFSCLYCNTNAVAFASSSVLADMDFHTIYMANGLQKFDGDVIGNTTITNNATYTFILFAMRANASVNHYEKCRIRYAKFWYDGDLVRNLIPALRNSDNKPGLYDTVNGVFYVNQGSGEFLYA